MTRSSPPDGFGDAFFAWLDEVSEELMVSFFPGGATSNEVLAELESRIGMAIPEQLRSFYRHCNPWGVVGDWSSWDETPLVRAKTGIGGPFAPIDLSGYSSTSVHTLAALGAEDRIRVIRYNLHERDGIRHIHDGDLRSYVLLLVDEEDSACCG